MTNAWPEVVTHDEKIRRLFDEFDTRRSRAIELDAFTSAFRRFNVAFSSATVNDLFEKTDMNKDRVISLQEFQRFGEIYPTMVDCLYYRARDFHNDLAQREAMENSQQVMSQLREREQQARSAREQALMETDAVERKVQAAHQAVADAQAGERAAQASMDAAHQDTEKQRAELQQLVRDLTTLKDRERQRAAEATEATRTVEAATRTVHAQDQEYIKAEDKLREIERLLLEQQREVEKQRYGCDQTRAELASAQGREQEAVAAEEDAKRQVHHAADRVADGEARVQQQQEAERAAAIHLRETAAEVARCANQRDAEQRDLAAAKDRERQREQEEEATRNACDAQEAQLHQMEQDAADFAARRRQVDDEEHPLLEQEVRLREQRDSLESKETKLRTDFQQFTGRASRPGSPAVSQYGRQGGLPAASTRVEPPPPAPAAYYGKEQPAAASALPQSVGRYEPVQPTRYDTAAAAPPTGRAPSSVPRTYETSARFERPAVPPPRYEAPAQRGYDLAASASRYNPASTAGRLYQ